MINQTKSKMVSTLIRDYLSRGWYINFGPNEASLGDASRFYITNGTNTISSTLELISFPGVGLTNDILWDKNGNVEAIIPLD